MPLSDTIVVLSTGKLPSGVAVVRLSGPTCRFALETIFGSVPAARQAVYGALRTSSGEPLDAGLAVYFPAPRSFTGEDCAEFHVHGSRAVVGKLLVDLTSLPGIRHAEPGEFTRRAFLNGKMDLTAAEALADLLAAETDAQRRLALFNMDGAQLRQYEDWRQRLLTGRALVEAELDFADESDVPGSVSDQAWAEVNSLADEIEKHITGFSRAEMVREGVQVVILGAPNAGKSSLLNALARREVAIVSDEPGTTRDLVEVSLDLDGSKVVLTDTAGLRESASRAETEGVTRARTRAGAAHLVLLLEDVSAPVTVDFDPGAVPVCRIGAKADLPAANGERTYDLLVSSRSGAGLDGLLEYLATHIRDMTATSGETLPSRQRHVAYLKECTNELRASLSKGPLELRAEHLRRSAEALGRITGRVDVEDLLGQIFSEFCVGK